MAYEGRGLPAAPPQLSPPLSKMCALFKNYAQRTACLNLAHLIILDPIVQLFKEHLQGFEVPGSSEAVPPACGPLSASNPRCVSRSDHMMPANSNMNA